MPVRTLSRRQSRENDAFLKALRATGNARLAALVLGVNRSTYTKRRSKHPAFAAAWDSALEEAHARIQTAPQTRSSPAGSSRSCRAQSRHGFEPGREALRTQGGEPTITRLKNGRLQLRRSPPGRMTKAAEQAFLRALSASANVRLSAAAAGFAHSSFYSRKRGSRVFAREMRLALAMGYERLEMALLQASDPRSRADDAWRRNDPPPIPPLTADQAMQLLFLHEKSVRQGWDQPHRRKRRGEPWETYTERLRAMWTAEKAREAEDAAVRRAAREQDEREAARSSGSRRRGASSSDPPVPDLPALEQVTGWSKAKGKPPHNPDLALFRGWRLKDWKKREAGKG